MKEDNSSVSSSPPLDYIIAAVNFDSTEALKKMSNKSAEIKDNLWERIKEQEAQCNKNNKVHEVVEGSAIMIPKAKSSMRRKSTQSSDSSARSGLRRKSTHSVEYDLEDILAGKIDFDDESEHDNDDDAVSDFTFDSVSAGNRLTRPKHSRRGFHGRTSGTQSDPGCETNKRSLIDRLNDLHIRDEEVADIEKGYDNASKSQSVLIPKHYQRSSRVSFSTIEIRHYDRILGDNPSCSCGAPLSIGWKHDESKTIFQKVDDYEYSRTNRRGHDDLVIPKIERQKILFNLGYSRKEITNAVRTNLKLKKKRRQTVNNLSLLQVEDFIEGASKQISRLMRKRLGSKYLYKQWQGSVDSDIDASITSSLKSSFRKSISATEGGSDFVSISLDKDSVAFPSQI